MGWNGQNGQTKQGVIYPRSFSKKSNKLDKNKNEKRLEIFKIVGMKRGEKKERRAY